MALDKFFGALTIAECWSPFLGLDEECRRKLFEQKGSSFISRLNAPIFVMCEDG